MGEVLMPTNLNIGDHVKWDHPRVPWSGTGIILRIVENEDTSEEQVLSQWTDRYIGQDQELAAEHMNQDQEMLKLLGAIAYGFGPGVSIDTPGRGSFQLDTASWNWLRPLLVELVELRQVVGPRQEGPSEYAIVNTGNVDGITNVPLSILELEDGNSEQM
jgi:hypothetical protein